MLAANMTFLVMLGNSSRSSNAEIERQKKLAKANYHRFGLHYYRTGGWSVTSWWRQRSDRLPPSHSASGDQCGKARSRRKSRDVEITRQSLLAVERHRWQTSRPLVRRRQQENNTSPEHIYKMASQLMPLELIDRCIGSRMRVIMKGDKGMSSGRE